MTKVRKYVAQMRFFISEHIVLDGKNKLAIVIFFLIKTLSGIASHMVERRASHHPMFNETYSSKSYHKRTIYYYNVRRPICEGSFPYKILMTHCEVRLWVLSGSENFSVIRDILT